MAFNQGQGEQTYYGKGGDIKSSLIYISTNIGLGAEKATLNGHKGIIAWGTKVLAFDSILYITFKNDTEFLKRRDKAVQEIKEIHPQNGEEKFEKYNDLFRLLCERMAFMGIYPGQEIDEEIVTVDDEEEKKDAKP